MKTAFIRHGIPVCIAETESDARESGVHVICVDFGEAVDNLHGAIERALHHGHSKVVIHWINARH